MSSSNTKKKWVSSRLGKKKEELGIKTPPIESQPESQPKKSSRKVTKKKYNSSSNYKQGSKKNSKQGSNKNYKQGSKKSSKYNSKKNSKYGSRNNYSKGDNPRFGNKNGSKRNSYRRHKGPKHVIRISNLPEDITVIELDQLVSEWGSIGNINIKKYNNYHGTSTNCYIDFYNKEEADYFVEALDKTPFVNMMLSVMIMDFSSKG